MVLDLVKKNILYVEDEPIQARIFSKIIEDELKDYNQKVVVFNHGAEFINLLNNNHVQYKIADFSLILLDLSMYDVSGFAMLSEAKNRNIDIPIAILSARDEAGVKQKSLALGALDYFIKGKDIEELHRLTKFIHAKI